MNKHLTFEEKNALVILMDKFIRDNDHSTHLLVANYSLSYPDNPEKARKFFNNDDFYELKAKVEGSWTDERGEVHFHDMSYRTLIKNLLLTQVDDIDDIESMIGEFQKAIAELNVLREHLEAKDNREEDERGPEA